jgi:hypothetical protein
LYKIPFIPKEKILTTKKKKFLETNKSSNYRNNHLETKLKCFHMIKKFRTRIAIFFFKLKGKRPREGYFSKNKQLFSCSLLQQLLNK